MGLYSSFFEKILDNSQIANFVGVIPALGGIIYCSGLKQGGS